MTNIVCSYQTVNQIIMSEKPARTEYPIHSLFINRWSPRAFSDQTVSEEKIKTVLEAARWAASSYNEQPWRFIVGVKEKNNAYEKILDTLSGFNQTWAKNAPVLIMACGKKIFSHNQKPNRHYYYDVGQAMASLSLQATEEQLYIHQMAGFFPDKAREAFAIPADYDPVAAAAMGYLGNADNLDENHKKSELAARTRKPLTETCFGNGWGEPF